MVTQANSGMGEVHQKASLDDMAHALIWGIFTAIKGSSGGKNGCSNSGLCNTSSNTTVNMDGLTEEQAQKVADYYNNEATASNFIDGVIPSSCAKVNCVSFSYWFVSAFTDASEKGVTSGIIGDGSYIAEIEPKYEILEMIVGHFRGRFPNGRWAIVDVKRCYGAFYDGRHTEILDLPDTDTLSRSIAEKAPPDEFTRMWKSYYDTMAIKERLNPRLLRRCLPVRYWKHLHERQQNLAGPASRPTA